MTGAWVPSRTQLTTEAEQRLGTVVRARDRRNLCHYAGTVLCLHCVKHMECTAVQLYDDREQGHFVPSRVTLGTELISYCSVSFRG